VVKTLQKSTKYKSDTEKTVLDQGTNKKEIIVAANQQHKYLKLFKDKNVAVVANNTSVIF